MAYYSSQTILFRLRLSVVRSDLKSRQCVLRLTYQYAKKIIWVQEKPNLYRPNDDEDQPVDIHTRLYKIKPGGAVDSTHEFVSRH